MKTDRENLSTLPEGWVLATVGDLATKVQYGTSAKTNEESAGIPVMRMGNIVNGGLVCEDLKYLPATHGEFPDLLLDKGDVLFNRTNSAELVGKTAVYKGIPNPSSFASYLIRVRLVDEYFPDLLAYYINSVFGRKWISTVVSQQVGQANVNGTKLQALSIPVPPLAEQRRIVAKIEELFTKLNAGVESLKAAKAQIKRYRQSVLKAAVEGELTREWRERHKDELEPASVLLDRILRERRAKWEANQLSKMQAQGKTPKDDKWKAKYQEPAAPDVTGLPTLPNGWIWTTLPQLGELNRGKSKHRPRNDPKLYGGKYPFVQTGDIRHANGILRTYNQTYSEDGLKQSRLWKAGTLCITIAANIAETAILGFDACFPDSVVGFVAEFEHCNVRFVEAFFRTAKEDIERYAPATAQKNINLEILSDLAIPLPPLAEQDQIVAEVDRRLSVSDEIEATLDADLKRAERLRQSILKRAFEGKLVLQDPNDEPASVLLERIKAERTQQTSSG